MLVLDSQPLSVYDDGLGKFKLKKALKKVVSAPAKIVKKVVAPVKKIAHATVVNVKHVAKAPVTNVKHLTKAVKTNVTHVAKATKTNVRNVSKATKTNVKGAGRLAKKVAKTGALVTAAALVGPAALLKFKRSPKSQGGEGAAPEEIAPEEIAPDAQSEVVPEGAEEIVSPEDGGGAVEPQVIEPGEPGYPDSPSYMEPGAEAPAPGPTAPWSGDSWGEPSSWTSQLPPSAAEEQGAAPEPYPYSDEAESEEAEQGEEGAYATEEAVVEGEPLFTDEREEEGVDISGALPMLSLGLSAAYPELGILPAVIVSAASSPTGQKILKGVGKLFKKKKKSSPAPVAVTAPKAKAAPTAKKTKIPSWVIPAAVAAGALVLLMPSGEKRRDIFVIK